MFIIDLEDWREASLKLIYMIKQDIRIFAYVTYSRLNDWTDWAQIFYGHSWVAGGWYRLKKIKEFQHF